MTTILRIRGTAVVLCALSLLAAAPARAQTQLPAETRPSRAPAEDTRSYGSTPGTHNARLMSDVLREFGYNPDRLGRRQQERLDEVRYRLFPEAARRQRLNRSQAVAVVYVALVYPRGTGGRGGGGWNGGNGRDDGYDQDDDRGPGRSPYDRPRGGNGQCVELDQGIYELLNLTGGEGQMLFLDDEEQERVRNTATVVQRVAINRGFRQVADRAAGVIGALRAFSPSRRVVAERVAELKAAADQACGDRGQR